jgi:hypothetical protein
MIIFRVSPTFASFPDFCCKPRSKIKVLTGFVSPFGLNQLLKYIETNGQGAVVRPWVWIAALFVGPTLSSLANEYYLHITGKTIIRAEAIITQLVFEHALRIRMKSETDAAVSRRGDRNQSAEDPANVPVVESTSTQKPGRFRFEETRLKSKNLIGLINNLVTTDLGNITDARDFLYAGL